MKYSKDREWYINLLLCFISLLGVIILPSAFYIYLSKIISNTNICELLSNILFIAVLIAFYYKDLIKEFKTYKKNFKSSFKISFKYYVVGLMAMVFFNMIIVTLLKDVSSNENQVRDLLFNNPVITMVSIMITAPLIEELAFRKSLSPLLKNKWLFATSSGILFGGAHLLTNFLTNTFVLTDLLYILPYGSLGFVFALMNRKTSSTFSSIVIHGLHNGCTGLLLLIFNSIGAL